MAWGTGTRTNQQLLDAAGRQLARSDQLRLLDRARLGAQDAEGLAADLPAVVSYRVEDRTGSPSSRAAGVPCGSCSPKVRSIRSAQASYRPSRTPVTYRRQFVRTSIGASLERTPAGSYMRTRPRRHR